MTVNAVHRLRECRRIGSYSCMPLFDRRMRQAVLPAVLALIAVSTAVSTALAAPAGKYLFYVGTYTEEGSTSKGIYAYSFDAATNEIKSLGLAAETTNPSFVALHPNGRFLYLANRAFDTVKVDGKDVFPGGENNIAVFSIDQASGEPTLIQAEDVRGVYPRTFALDPAARMLAVTDNDAAVTLSVPFVDATV